MGSELPFRRCASCGAECHRSNRACPNCEAAFDTPQQAADDARLANELAGRAASDTRAEQARQQRLDRMADEHDRAMQAVETRHTREWLEHQRLVDDMIAGEPLRHVLGDPLDQEDPGSYEARRDERIQALRSRETHLQRPAHPARPPRELPGSLSPGRASDVLTVCGLVVGLVGFFGRVVTRSDAGPQGPWLALAAIGGAAILTGLAWRSLK